MCKNNLHQLCHPEQGRRICKHPRVCIQILHFVQNDKSVKLVIIFISLKQLLINFSVTPCKLITAVVAGIRDGLSLASPIPLVIYTSDGSVRCTYSCRQRVGIITICLNSVCSREICISTIEELLNLVQSL